MDITHDWKTLNDVFFSQGNTFSPVRSNLVLIEEAGKIVDGVCSNGKMFSETPVDVEKSKLDALSAKYSVDQAVVLSKKNLDQIVTDVATLGTNYFQQLEILRKKLLQNVGPIAVSRKHFVLDLFSSHYRRLLPRKFNFLVFIDQRPVYSASMESDYQAVLLTYADGKLDQFFQPDFSSLHENRIRDWKNETAAIGQYLESRYLMPCFAVFIDHQEWRSCIDFSKESGGKSPWRLFVQVVDKGNAQVYPHKSILWRSLLATHRVVVYFGGA